MLRFALLIRIGIALRTAVDALYRNPMRAILTGLGILVGVAAVTIVITLGEGAERVVQKRIELLGENLITVRARAVAVSGPGQSGRAKLTENDAKAIGSAIDGVAHVAPVLDGLVRAVYRDRNAPAQAVGTTADYFHARDYVIESGAIWSESDEITSRRVVLVAPTVVEKLFLDEDPLGESIRIGRHLFRIVGVLGAKGQTPFGTDQDNLIVMPLGTMRAKISRGRSGEVRQILVAAKKDQRLAAIKRPLGALLRQRHHLKADTENDFSIRDQARMAQAQRGIVTVMRLLLLCIAGVSLVIGGIGVMNIMLVSVTERSREIGTRLAVGAQGTDILIQFLIEAMVLSILGGAAGALLAALLVSPLEGYFGWPLSVSLRSLVIALIVSLTIGVFFGLLPARRAAMMDPVEALRRD